MAADVQMKLEGGVIRVHYRGRAEFDEADYRGYYVSTIEHARQGPALGIDKGFRIALLGGGDPMVAYFENVALNRGYRAKAFTDESLAFDWLREDASARRF